MIMTNFLTLVLLPVVAITAVDMQIFKITTKRESDRVKVRADTDKAIVSIHSPVGISQVAVERTNGKWPEAVVIRLHLQGLESFQISNGNVKLEASVSSQNGTVRLWQDDKEDALLDAESSLWMEIRMVGKDRKPTRTIPLKEGYFEMQLPKGTFKGNPKTITMSWIDFHRN